MLNRRGPLTTWRFWLRALTVLRGVVGAATLLVRAQSVSSTAVSNPGATADGTILLPNGWRLGPVGRHVPAGTLPLNLVQSADGRYLIVVSSGLSAPAITVVDLPTWTVTSTLTLAGAWYGLVRHRSPGRRR